VSVPSFQSGEPGEGADLQTAVAGSKQAELDIIWPGGRRLVQPPFVLVPNHGRPETIHKAPIGKRSTSEFKKASFRYAAMRPATCDDAIAGGASLKNISVGEPSLWLTRMRSPG
jgi:hypothetical protein